ncbi:MAG: hypothetical protein M0Z75_03160 [Nitrospiraceae bacterium]|nr:hypothetical protein [Nitrospiraceae bacterium]MDA8091491.1 hypothetical protein [Nitrospiraceae bacterium]
MRNKALLVIVSLFVLFFSSPTRSGHAIDAGKTKFAGTKIVVTERAGIKHSLTNVQTGNIQYGHFSGAGSPFSEANLPEYENQTSQLDTCIALNFHTPEAQAQILRSAKERGGLKNDLQIYQVVLIVPLSSVEMITFGKADLEYYNSELELDKTTSSVKIVGKASFNAGAPFGFLTGKEALGPLGHADFSAQFKSVKEIRSSGLPAKFSANFAMFGIDAVPFKSTVTDTAGHAFVFEKAVFCKERQVTKTEGSFYVTYVGYNTVRCSSDVTLKRGGSRLSVPSIKLQRIEIGNGSGDGYDANVALRSGEKSFDLWLPDFSNRGILGATPYGWVWVPWTAIQTVEFQGS